MNLPNIPLDPDPVEFPEGYSFDDRECILHTPSAEDIHFNYIQGKDLRKAVNLSIDPDPNATCDLSVRHFTRVGGIDQKLEHYNFELRQLGLGITKAKLASRRYEFMGGIAYLRYNITIGKVKDMVVVES